MLYWQWRLKSLQQVNIYIGFNIGGKKVINALDFAWFCKNSEELAAVSGKKLYNFTLKGIDYKFIPLKTAQADAHMYVITSD